MSAQPADALPPRNVVRIPKTIPGVRAALAAEQRAQFQAELDVTAIPDISAMVERWWLWAVVEASPRAAEALDRAQTGRLNLIPIEDAVGAERWQRALAEAGL